VLVDPIDEFDVVALVCLGLQDSACCYLVRVPGLAHERQLGKVVAFIQHAGEFVQIDGFHCDEVFFPERDV
jgi:hypothetical protein